MKRVPSKSLTDDTGCMQPRAGNRCAARSGPCVPSKSLTDDTGCVQPRAGNRCIVCSGPCVAWQAGPCGRAVHGGLRSPTAGLPLVTPISPGLPVPHGHKPWLPSPPASSPTRFQCRYTVSVPRKPQVQTECIRTHPQQSNSCHLSMLADMRIHDLWMILILHVHAL